jgi:hypothetical protein
MLSVVMLSVVMLSVIMLNVIMLNVIMLNVIMLSVLASVSEYLVNKTSKSNSKIFSFFPTNWQFHSEAFTIKFFTDVINTV